MKKILKSLFLVFFLIALVAGATRAVWTDQASITNNAFTSGNADLDLWDGNSYEDTISTFIADNIYPGWIKDSPFWAKNTSTAAIPLAVTVGLSSLGGNTVMKDNIKLKFSWNSGANVTTEQSLQWWKENIRSLGSLNQNEERLYTAHFRLPTSVGNELQNKNVNFVVLLNATQ
jgi:predicted ribosomally synthesized peptide with SipW-like signal peptide